MRFEMLSEAIDVIRLLWQGGYQSHHGAYYTVEQARLYTLPEEPPPIMVAAGGPNAAELAATAGDGLIGTAPDRKFCPRSRPPAERISREMDSSRSAGQRTRRRPGRPRSSGGRMPPPRASWAKSSHSRATSSR